MQFAPTQCHLCYVYRGGVYKILVSHVIDIRHATYAHSDECRDVISCFIN